MTCGTWCISLPVLDSDTKLAEAMGKVLVSLEDEGGKFTGDVQDYPELQKALAEDSQEHGTGEPPAQHSDDPSLARKVKLSPRSNSLSDIEAAICTQLVCP